MVDDRVRDRMDQGRGHDDVLAEGAVVGRGRQEADVGAQVVPAGETLRAGAAADARLHPHALPGTGAAELIEV